MQTVRVQFEEHEEPASIARRVSVAFARGSTLRVRDKFYRVIGPGNTYLTNRELVGDNYTDVLPLEGQRDSYPEIPPPSNEVEDVPPSQKQLLSPELPQRPAFLVGQTWQPKDSRRKGHFTIIKTDGEFVYGDDGRKVAISRMSRYRLT